MSWQTHVWQQVTDHLSTPRPSRDKGKSACNESLTWLLGNNSLRSIDWIGFDLLRHCDVTPARARKECLRSSCDLLKVVNGRKCHRCSQKLNTLLSKEIESRNRRKKPQNSVFRDSIGKKVRWFCRIRVLKMVSLFSLGTLLQILLCTACEALSTRMPFEKFLLEDHLVLWMSWVIVSYWPLCFQNWNKTTASTKFLLGRVGN